MASQPCWRESPPRLEEGPTSLQYRRPDPVEPPTHRDGNRLLEREVLVLLGRLVAGDLEEFLAELLQDDRLGLFLRLDLGVDPAVLLAIERLGAKVANIRASGGLGIKVLDTGSARPD